MRIRFRVAAAAIAASASLAASAHEFECTMQAGRAVAGCDGAPLLDEAGVPVWSDGAAGVLRVDDYPALIAFSVEETNTAGVESIALGHFAAIDGWEGGADRLPLWSWSWPDAGPFAPGESVTFGAAVLLDSYETCLALSAHLAEGEPVCGGAVAENRWGVIHDSGYAECRARIECLPQAPQPLANLSSDGVLP